MARGIGQHHGDLRRGLLDAALELVAEKDAGSLSLRAVARRAGVSAAAPYHHFEDKDALLAAVAREGFEQLAQAQAQVPVEEARGRLQALGATYVRFALAHPVHYGIMFRTTPGQVEAAVGDALRETAMSTYETLVAAIAAVRPGLNEGQVRGLALLAWAQGHGAVEVARWGAELDPAFDLEAFAEQVGASIVAIAEGGPRPRRR